MTSLRSATMGAALGLGWSLLPAPGWGQTVTLAELQGATVHFEAVHRERFIRGGQMRSGEIHTSGEVRIGPGDAITTSVGNTFVSEHGSRAGPTGSGTFTLNKPAKNRAGDDLVWLFSDGSLVRLRVHGGGGSGGQKLTLAFTRGADGLHCAFSMPFAREVGGGDIRKGSAIDGVPIEILSWQPAGSSCRVTK